MVRYANSVRETVIVCILVSVHKSVSVRKTVSVRNMNDVHNVVSVQNMNTVYVEIKCKIYRSIYKYRNIFLTFAIEKMHERRDEKRFGIKKNMKGGEFFGRLHGGNEGCFSSLPNLLSGNNNSLSAEFGDRQTGNT